jgi:hypothetical protein
MSTEQVAEPIAERIQCYTKTELTKEQWSTVFDASKMHQGCEIEKIFEIDNKELRKTWLCKLGDTIIKNDLQQNQIMDLFHTPNIYCIEDILNNGLDTKFAKGGYFGRALYFTNSFEKANFYSKHKGNPDKTRIMLICAVITGNVKVYDIGRSIPNLNKAPEGFDSVSGIIINNANAVSDYEYTVYNNSQVLITHMILYKFKDTAYEMKPNLKLPPGVDRNTIVNIPFALTRVFTVLEEHTKPNDLLFMKRNIELLLRQIITPEQFIENCDKLFSAKSPESFVEHFKILFSQSKKFLPTPPAVITPEMQNIYNISTQQQIPPPNVSANLAVQPSTQNPQFNSQMQKLNIGGSKTVGTNDITQRRSVRIEEQQIKRMKTEKE